MNISNVVNTKIFAVVSLAGITLSIIATLLFIGSAQVTPFIELSATYPWLPQWVLTSVTFVLNGVATASAIAVILGSFGLAAIASVIISYARRYGVAYAVAW